MLRISHADASPQLGGDQVDQVIPLAAAASSGQLLE